MKINSTGNSSRLLQPSLLGLDEAKQEVYGQLHPSYKFIGEAWNIMEISIQEGI